jgi:hypothetical protein
MESWKHVFRRGIAPFLPTRGLQALSLALATNDKRVLQSATTSPPPLACVSDWTVEAACPIGFCGWQNGEGLNTVVEVEQFFGNVCFMADQAIGEPAACRHFVNWADDTPRQEMFDALLVEVVAVLIERAEAERLSA